MTIIELVKITIETFVKEGKIISPPDDLSEEFLKEKSGTFITIKKNGKLRGCIGTYLPTQINIAQEIIRNAVAAATKDYRFGPIQKEELPNLSYIVYILSYPEPVKDINTLNPKKFGIVVRTGPLAFPNEESVVFNGLVPYRTGVLLPDLEGVDTIERQISIACRKGGFDPTKEKILIYRFTVKKYQ